MKTLFCLLAFTFVGCQSMDRLINGPEETTTEAPELIGGVPAIGEAPNFNIAIPDGYDRIIFHGALPLDGIIKINPNPDAFADVFMKQLTVGTWFKIGDTYNEAFWYSIDLTAGTITYHGKHLNLIEYAVYEYVPMKKQ